MATVIGKKKLCSTENYEKYFKSIQGLEGQSLFTRYYAIENIITSFVDKKYRHFLAQPIIDLGAASITWYSKQYQETPQVLSALSGDTLGKYTAIKDETVAHYQQIIKNLKSDPQRQTDAQVLESALKFIDNRFVFCYDNLIVLGVWGMQLRLEIKEPLGVAMVNQFVKSKKAPDTPQEQPDVPETQVDPDETIDIPKAKPFVVKFSAGESGKVVGASEFTKYQDDVISGNEIPEIDAQSGFLFTGWSENPHNYVVGGDKEFIAQYRKIAPIRLPWYIRFWNWLKSIFANNRWLKWLWRLLLLLLFLLLLSWLLKRCGAIHSLPGFPPIGGTHFPTEPDTRSGMGGIYNPGDPYQALPTSPDLGNILPPQQGVLTPIDTSGLIRTPGHPPVFGNILNVLMENEDKHITDLAKEFKIKHPGNEYKIVYYDDVVKRMQIEVPANEREQLKQQIPGEFAPNYKLFVFDESLFEEEDITPNDPAFRDPAKSWYLNVINAPKAWEISKGAKKKIIAIVDNGFNLGHPELKDKIVMPYNVWLHSKEIFPQTIDHGTHVAGIALATMGNGQGLCGIAPDCGFMPIQVADRRGVMTTTSVLDGVLYALYQGANVVNVSLGQKIFGTLPESTQRDLQDNHFKEEERLWDEIMQIANKHNATIVIAAGNENVLAGINPMNRQKNFIVVSAVDKTMSQYSKAGFSNFGDYATLSAPGVDIYSTVGANGYALMSGTSMAAPIVAGGVALLKSLDPGLTTEQIICILQSTGKVVGGNVGNLVQLDKALEKVHSGRAADCGSQPAKPSSGDVQVLLNWNNYNDLDLACTDPEGNTVWFKNKRVPSGGLLEIDMNVKPHHSTTPIENIFWQAGSAPKGKYEVYLWLYKVHDPAINETPYKVTVKYGNKSEIFNGRIKQEDGRIKICEFSLGNQASPPAANRRFNFMDGVRDELQRNRNSLLKQVDSIDRELSKIKKK